MNILVIGSGGREHGLCWAIAKSPQCDRLICAPGNGGIAEVADCMAVDISDHQAVIDLCKANEVDFVVVGPEVPLVAGLADDLIAAGIKTFGPSAAAAQLEGSKGFTKDLCAKHNIPTAAYARFSSGEPAKAYVRKQSAPLVIKADGLAAGKGVVIAQSLDEACATVDEIFGGAFGEAGAEVVVEDFLVGEEASFFALVDGKNTLALATAQDHKQVGDGDTGPNTGGMGAYSPAPVMTEELCQRTMDEIILPTVAAMAEAGTPFRGVLFAGLMITDKGPELIEYNVRFGDPECQVMMMRLRDDLVTLLLASAEGQLDHVSARWIDDVALTVVMAAKGYPGSYEKNTEIGGLADAGAGDDVEIFHAGTARSDTGACLATGGRVLNVTGIGATVAEAQAKAYAAVDKVDWPGGFCRRDIGWRAVAREKA
ncbi:MAG: phosphoribosylamine--glycine ligase [Alphaproteobacteria bacterium]|nr:phosphoribosylamine--glycine ligase [Alphaproteobacteria bacterium]